MGKAELIEQLVGDLLTEHDTIRDLLLSQDDTVWETATPAPGWTVRDQVSHLAYFDRATQQAVSDPDAFRAATTTALENASEAVSDALSYGSELSGPELLDQWRTDRIEMIEAIRQAPADYRMPWYGPDMGVASALSARTMETWAHGQDIFDTVGTEHLGSPAIRHVCDIGIRARPFAYLTNGRDVPASRVRVELTGPDGSTWEWGAADAEGKVTGSAEEFARVVTQRLNLADTALQIEGADAQEWMDIAQAFAGPPGKGREPQN